MTMRLESGDGGTVAIDAGMAVGTETGRDEGRGARAGRGMTLRSLVPFLAMTFGLTWGLGSSFAFFPEFMTSLFGEMSYTNPLFIVMVYSPGFAGLFLVWRHYGLSGLGRYLRRLTMWRMAPVWWALLAL